MVSEGVLQKAFLSTASSLAAFEAEKEHPFDYFSPPILDLFSGRDPILNHIYADRDITLCSDEFCLFPLAQVHHQLKERHPDPLDIRTLDYLGESSFCNILDRAMRVFQTKDIVAVAENQQQYSMY